MRDSSTGILQHVEHPCSHHKTYSDYCQSSTHETSKMIPKQNPAVVQEVQQEPAECSLECVQVFTTVGRLGPALHPLPHL